MSGDALPSIRGYRMLRRLGEGGMGQVFLAEDETLERKVAIKVISQAHAGEGMARSRFLREARAMAGVEHPNVVRIYAFGEAEGNLYIVMEYVEGETLAGRLARLTRLAAADAVRIASEVAQALAAAWRRGIVHRDVKPANILLDGDDRVKVADFGLARSGARDGADPEATAEGSVLGTPHYMSPEQARGQDTDFRSDIYSLGIVLYEMLCGGKPFTGASPMDVLVKHLREPIPPLGARCPDVPASVTAVVETMTAKAPEQRPPSYPELLGLLARPAAAAAPWSLLTSSMPSLRSPTGGAVRARRGHPAALALGALTIVGVLAGLYGTAAARREAAFTVAVSPLYGPDEESDKEARVLAALVQSEIGRRLPDDVDVKGTDEVKTVVRSARGARTLADALDADVVVWGEALSFRGEVELAARLTTRDGTLIEAIDGGALAPGLKAIETRRARAAAVAEQVAALYSRRPRP